MRLASLYVRAETSGPGVPALDAVPAPTSPLTGAWSRPSRPRSDLVLAVSVREREQLVSVTPPETPTEGRGHTPGDRVVDDADDGPVRRRDRSAISAVRSFRAVVDRDDLEVSASPGSAGERHDDEALEVRLPLWAGKK